MLKRYGIGLALGAALFSVALPVSAAGTFFAVKNPELQAGQLFKADVFVDASDDDVNAVEGVVVFPSELLELKELNDANAIFSLWIKRPAATAEGLIPFAGIIPGGYGDERGFMFSATFLAKKAGSGSLRFEGVRMLRNDGLGTEVPHSASGFRFVISEPAAPRQEPKPEGQIAAAPSAKPLPAAADAPPQSTVQGPVEESRDRIPPEEFIPAVASDPRVFDGRPFLVFAAQDKVSGISHYEVCEGGRDCVIAESPYLLRDGDIKEDIRVKAVDKDGNERTAVVQAQNKQNRRFSSAFYALIAAAAAIIFGVGTYLARRRS